MIALIVGSDSIDTIRKEAAAVGIDTIEHWSGRRPAELRRRVPRNAAVVLVVWNFANHEVVRHVRTEAARFGIPVVYSSSSVADVRTKLREWAHAA